VVVENPEASVTEREPGGPPPPGVDVSVAHPARVRNFWLGGHDWFKADRLAGLAIAREFPHLPETARAERAFLVRATRFLAGPARIRQFLDLGSGLPAGGNTHEIAQRIAADAVIAYVDNDPVVLAHAKAMLHDPARHAEPGPVSFIDADLRDVRAVLHGAASTLDFGQPVALIMLGILGHLQDYGAARSITSQLLAALPAGSYLAIADGVSGSDSVNRAQLRFNASRDIPYDTAADPYYLRRPDELASFFDALDLVEPGVVPCAEWKPDRTAPDRGAPDRTAPDRTVLDRTAPDRGGPGRDAADETPVYCGVARKP
jgi:hypothetical protein